MPFPLPTFYEVFCQKMAEKPVQHILLAKKGISWTEPA